jgi:hypothetical protein
MSQTHGLIDCRRETLLPGPDLVVLVSHVAEMRDAIEDLVVLEKDAVTGDTVVVSGAMPEALAP